jgi:ABC-type glycerol-3-phosphate transport system permease component
MSKAAATSRPIATLAQGLQLALLLVLALAMLLPLIWLVSTSLKGPAEDIFTSPPGLLPSQPSLEARSDELARELWTLTAQAVVNSDGQRL